MINHPPQRTADDSSNFLLAAAEGIASGEKRADARRQRPIVKVVNQGLTGSDLTKGIAGNSLELDRLNFVALGRIDFEHAGELQVDADVLEHIQVGLQLDHSPHLGKLGVE